MKRIFTSPNGTSNVLITVKYQVPNRNDWKTSDLPGIQPWKISGGSSCPKEAVGCCPVVGTHPSSGHEGTNVCDDAESAVAAVNESKKVFFWTSCWDGTHLSPSRGSCFGDSRRGRRCSKGNNGDAGDVATSFRGGRNHHHRRDANLPTNERVAVLLLLKYYCFHPFGPSPRAAQEEASAAPAAGMVQQPAPPCRSGPHDTILHHCYYLHFYFLL